MKKVIKHPDGREETVEGTAEEIAEYERKLREGGKSRGKKPVLHGAEVDGEPLTDAEIMLIRLSRAGLLPKESERKEVTPWYPTPFYQPYLWQPERSFSERTCRWCGTLDCQQTHIICEQSIVSDNTLQGPTIQDLGTTVAGALTSFKKMNEGWTPPVR